MSFQKFDPRQSVSDMEQEILAYWDREQIFQKSIDRRDKDQLYTFYDGPPFATGTPHYGHIVASTIKDVVPRYWTMKGRRVERVWGWDCHGLPIENIVEKELGSKSKKDIEQVGVTKFNELCRSKVLEYAGEWERIIPRLGRWADMKNAYRTMDKDFMESVWWVFKDVYDKGLVYEDYRAMHVCPRCETTLSQSEVAEGYADIKDLSVTAQFALADDPDTYILAWTTTPWTLPGNVALAVGPDITYVKVLYEGKQYIVAKNRAADVFTGKEYEIGVDVSASELIGLSYVPLWDYYTRDKSLKNHKNGWKVYAADFITDDSGTGIAHEAPAFGADDMAFGKQYDLPWIQHVNIDGTIKAEAIDFAGLNVKPRVGGKDAHQLTDIEVIKNLAHSGKLFHKEKYEHSYPHCWRCDTPLLNYATSSWFLSVEQLKSSFLEGAQSIHWSPEHIKDGRWGKWLEGSRDWSISRQRFWASVIPLWKCDTCHAQDVFGSAKELEEKAQIQVTDLHKHIVDEVTYDCGSCNGTMRRIPDVLDTWFDSGSMPYAQMHYPFEHKEKFENNFPADFISEGVDQTRCWFYYMHVLASGVMQKNAFQNVIVNGIVLAEDGKKMSKKLKNYPDPMETIDRYGADALRLYLMSSPVVRADNLHFSEKELSEVVRGPLRMLKQSYSFFTTYAAIDGWSPEGSGIPSSTHVLDRWVVDELHRLINNVDVAMHSYDLQSAARSFGPFIDDLSNWYIRRSRSRFWKSEDDADKAHAYATLHYVLVQLATAMAPFTPFLSEEIYRSLTQGESVHLADFPESPQVLDDRLIVAMRAVREDISQGLEMRSAQGVKVRQPLAVAYTRDSHADDLNQILQEELNVKEVRVREMKHPIDFEWDLTPNLILEGQAREIIRFIQQGRKKAGFELDDRICIGYEGSTSVFDAYGTLIAHETLAHNIEVGLLSDFDYQESISSDELDFSMTLKKV